LCLLAACSSSGSGAAPEGGAPDGSSSDLAPSDLAPTVDGPVSPNACGALRAAAPTLPGSRDPKVLARAAVVVGSCIADDGIDRNLDYMWASSVNHGRYWNRTAMQADCLAAAHCGCGAVEYCLGWEQRQGSGASAPICTGSNFTWCDEPAPGRFVCLSVDCAAVGLTCDENAICVEAPVRACVVANAGQMSCNGVGRVNLCSTGLADGATLVGAADCPAAGLACIDGQCVGSGAACTANVFSSEGDLRLAGLSCSGAMMDACVGGKHATIDCSKVAPGFTCQTFSGQSFCGLGSECLPGNLGPTAAKCEGNMVVFCNAGRVERVDCTSLGFTGCEVAANKGHYGCIPTIGE
jgi:hypothetical protein